MHLAIKEAIKAAEMDEVPIGAVIVKDDKVIAKAHNLKEKNNQATHHAEMLVIQKASKKLGTWYLRDCDLYVTLKPCSMCEAAIRQSRIKNVYYLMDKENYKKEYQKTNIIKTNIRTIEEKYTKELSSFFKKQRDKK